MDALSIISSVAGGAGVLAAAAILASLVSKFLLLAKAERDLKSRTSQASKENLRTNFGSVSKHGAPDFAAGDAQQLSSTMNDLVQNADIRKSERQALLSALRQPSNVGKVQYARKLYAAVAGLDRD